MQQLLSQLGVDWHLLLAQAVNFFLLLVVLRLFVYQPLLKLLRDRRQKIAEGVMKAEEAESRLKEANKIGLTKIKEAEVNALGILKKTEAQAKELEARLLAEAKQKEVEAIEKTDILLRAREEASRQSAEKEAAGLVRRAIAKTVELAPGAIDDALISRAVKEAASS